MVRRPGLGDIERGDLVEVMLTDVVSGVIPARSVVAAAAATDARPSAVMIFTHSLSQGGTQEMVKRLAEGLSRRGNSVTVVCQQGDPSEPRPLSPGIGYRVLDTSRVIKSIMPLITLFNREQPDVVISALSHNNLGAVLVKLLSFGRWRLILTEHAPLSRLVQFYNRWSYRVLPIAIRTLYPVADTVVAVSEGVASDLKQIAPGLKNLRVIFNPIVDDLVHDYGADPSPLPWTGIPVIVAAGRLVVEKDFDFLLRAFARLRRERDVRLAILGEGPEREALTRLADELGIAEDVALLGWQTAPMAYFCHAAVLAVTSRFEGFGNVIAEALACGTPVVSTDCPVGPAEILEGGRYGTLVTIGDEEGFARALGSAIDAPPDRILLKQRAQEFSVTASVLAYDRLVRPQPRKPSARSASGRPLRLAIYMNDLSGGGVERMRLRLIPALQARGVEVTLLLHSLQGDLVPLLPKGLKTVAFGTSRTLWDLFPLWAYLRRERPDALLSSLDHNNVVAAFAAGLSGTKTASIICQHNSLSDEARELGVKYRIIPFLYRVSRLFVHQVIGVSSGVAEDLIQTCGMRRDIVNVIYNPIIDDDLLRRANEPVEHPWFADRSIPVFVTAGRMVAQKDHATLLRAFALLLKQKPARLMVLGTGPLRDELDRLAAELEITDSIDFLGFQANPLPYFRQADAFVLSSRHEGLGNVLVEAMGCGTPVISTDCPYGPAEILENGKYGILVPVGDVEALAAAMASEPWRRWSHDDLIASTSRFQLDDIALKYIECVDRAREASGS